MHFSVWHFTELDHPKFSLQWHHGFSSTSSLALSVAGKRTAGRNGMPWKEMTFEKWFYPFRTFNYGVEHPSELTQNLPHVRRVGPSPAELGHLTWTHGKLLFHMLRTFSILPRQKKWNKCIYFLTDHTEFVHFLMQYSAWAPLLTLKLFSNCSRHLQTHCWFLALIVWVKLTDWEV